MPTFVFSSNPSGKKYLKDENTIKQSPENNNKHKKSRIRETPTLSTDADSRTDTNLKRLRDSSKKNKKKVLA